MARLRKVLPDAVLVVGFGCAMYGAFMVTPWLALLVFGALLVGLAIWMGA